MAVVGWGNNQALEIDDDEDAVVDDNASETTSIASTLLRGHFENGRRYNSLRDDYWGPADSQQFDSMDSGHYVHLMLLCETENALFRAPVGEVRRVLDVGCGTGTWAIDCADKYPDATVHGIDLFPPENNWVPPNCFLEVEDAAKAWTWTQQFDLIRMSYMLGSFTDEGWTNVYKEIYNNLEEGGWIEQVEPDCRIMCEDGSLPTDSYAAGWGETFFACAERMGRSIKTVDEMKSSIKAASFISVQEQYYKVPVGPWCKDAKLKEIGRVSQNFWLQGLDGFAMFLLTRFGSPAPWTQEEVLAYTGKVRAELKDPKIHAWHYVRRVWGQKPAQESLTRSEDVGGMSTTPGT